ncbi:aminoacyl-tRNA hydrolase [Candidatus Kuenenbacteria bacterium]|nr:aminoacyl-tRNA hydrolase [Candidatus Kuenenbacteria bacterium]
MKIIVGLGNPGKKYQFTRHNIGFAVIEFLRDEYLQAEGFSKWSDNKKFQARISEGNLNGEKIILAKPLTFMNESGTTVQALLNFYKTAPEDLIVIHDEVDLPFGKFKIEANRSSAGHNGIKSIIEKIGSQEFTRVRVGVGKENKQKQGDTARFVLNSFGFLEKFKLKELKNKLVEEIKTLLN